ncbi:MAG TPA: orotidine-5'-phosphate decarboxylase [Acidimicrobiales bacterium]|nr:orotidine-5'-phosphate decarboxylase [Acidimicrobiales bacterium]
MAESDRYSSEAFARARQRIVLALDVDTLDEALALSERVRAYVGTVKIGLELYLAEGPRSVAVLRSIGLEVFLDLKLHDIPTTVERSARVVGGLGARFLTVHTLGGAQMVRAALNGATAGAEHAGCVPPTVVGVTVLTSDLVAPPEELIRRVHIAVEGGCGAFVCAAPDLAVVRSRAPHLVAVVPGIRPPGSAKNDQSRTMTPAMALAKGADLLVIGRPITRANVPEEAALAIVRSVMDASP